MAILKPDHLFEQAEKLISSSHAGQPQQVDLRRAVSAAYYGVFHHIPAAAADDFVGITKKSTKHYALVYRGIDHRTLRDVCNEVKKQQLSAKYQKYSPASGFGHDIPAVAKGVVELQERRHSADYDPLIKINTSDPRLAIATARVVVQRFENAHTAAREAFLSLLLFQAR